MSSDAVDGSDSGTKSSLKNAQIAADRRLIEYFVIVSSVELVEGADEPTSQAKSDGDLSFQEWKTEFEEETPIQFRPTITARYPLVDHPDNPLHDNVIFFCHPSGKIRLRMQPYMPKVRALFERGLFYPGK